MTEIIQWIGQPAVFFCGSTFFSLLSVPLPTKSGGGAFIHQYVVALMAAIMLYMGLKGVNL